MPPFEEETQTLDNQGVDTAAALAEISSDLFGQVGEAGAGEGDKSIPSEGTEVTPAADDVEKTPPQENSENSENSEAVQEVGAPKTWTKEALETWASIPPRAQAEILKREGDFLNGITKYKASAEVGDRYNSVVEPYAPILQQENIDPVQLFQSFAANHYLLSRGTDEQKVELAANLIQSYGVDFSKLAGRIADRIDNAPDPEVAALRKEVEELRAGREREKQTAIQQTRAQIDKEISDFAANPANIYFNDLIDDIAQIMKNGLATDLKTAYEQAVFMNPVTRQKELDRLTASNQTSVSAEEQARKDKIARATAADVNVIPSARNGTVPVGSMDDTLAETLRAIQSRS